MSAAGYVPRPANPTSPYLALPSEAFPLARGNSLCHDCRPPPLTEHALTGLAQELELALDADDPAVLRGSVGHDGGDFPDDLLH